MASACCTGEVFLQTAFKPWMGQTSVFEIGDHRAVAVNRCSKARSDRQGKHAIMFPMTNAVFGFSEGYCIGVVEHGKAAAVKPMKGSPHVLAHPRCAKIRCCGRPQGFHCTGKTQPDGPGPSKVSNRRNQCW